MIDGPVVVHISNSGASVAPGQPRQNGGIETLRRQLERHQADNGATVIGMQRLQGGGSHHDAVRRFDGPTEIIEIRPLSVDWRLEHMAARGEQWVRKATREVFAQEFERIHAKQGRIDIVHVHNLHKLDGTFDFVPASVLPELIERFHAKALHHIHNVYPIGTSDVVNVMRSFEHQVFVSHAVRKRYEAIGAAQPEAPVVSPGVDVRMFHPDGPLHEVIGKQTGLKIGLPGRFAPMKGGPVLIEAMGIVNKERPDLDWTVTMCDSSLPHGIDTAVDTRRAEFYALIEEHGVADRFALLAVDYDDMPKAMRTWDLTTHPSVEFEGTAEGWGQTLNESMASGTPCVTSSGGAQEECDRLVYGDLADPTLAEPGSPRSLADAMLRLMTNPTLRNALGERGIVEARNRLDLSHMLTGIDAVYKRMLSTS